VDRGYTQSVVYIERKGGIPKWRLLLAFAAVFGLLTQLPTETASADTFAGPGVTCKTVDHALADFAVAGYQGFHISFHLTIPAGGVVRAGWQSSDGSWSDAPTFYGGGATAPSKEWFVYGSETQVVLDGNKTGRAQFVIGKATDYGGCFSVDQVVITRYASTMASNPPAPTPTTGPSDPPGPGCDRDTDPNCVAPAGWCWAIVGGHPSAPDYGLVECSAGPSAAPDMRNGSVTCTVDNSAQNTQTGLSVAIGPIAVGDLVTFSYTRTSWPSGAFAGGLGLDQASRWKVTSTNANVQYFFTEQANPPTSGTASWTRIGSAGTDKIWCKGPGRTAAPWVSFTVSWTITAGPTASAQPSYNPYPSPSAYPNPSGLPTMPPMPGNFEWPPYPPFSWPSYPPLPSGGGAMDQCEGPDDADLAICNPASAEPGTSFEAEDPGTGGQGEDGSLGPGNGSGVTECEGANLTPVESKVGYIAPDPVPTVVPLHARLTGFSIFTLDRVPTYMMSGIGWVGDMVGVIPPAVRNTAGSVYNAGVDLVVPGDCIGSIVETRLDEVMAEPPFSIYTELSEQLTAGAAGGGGMTLPGIPVPGGGPDIPLPLDMIQPTMSGLRPVLAAGVWLMTLVTLVRIVLGSFHVGRGGGGSE
jgi:hypothetical protein